jgi:3-methylcrotonyl-CoA carboxylase alpha subunit
LRFPDESAHVRVDTGVREGDAVSMYYDPMIAKIVTWDRDRTSALRRMRAALAATEVVGLNTNLSFLAAVAAHAAFRDAALDTGFIETHIADLVPEARPASNQILALAALAELLGTEAAGAAAAGDPTSPWLLRDGWRTMGRADIELRFSDDGNEIVIRARPEAGGYALALPDGSVSVRGALGEGGALLAEIDGVRVAATVVGDGDAVRIITHGHNHLLARVDAMAAGAGGRAQGGRLTAPMPGRIVAVHVSGGDKVKAGQGLMVLEAMKMEHVIAAPADGVVDAVRFAAGDQVNEGDELLAMVDS